MGNNIAVGITVDVADLTAKRAIASAELKSLQKDLNDLANTARTQGLTPELRTQMLAAGDATAKARSEVGLIDKEMRKLGVGAREAHVGMAGVTREGLVLVHEGMSGNFRRMAGSAMILTQRLGLLTPAVLGVGAVVLAVAAPFAAFALAAEQGSEDLARFNNRMEATNGYAGVTISQLQAMAKETAAWAHTGVGAAQKELEALASTGQFTGQTLQLIAADSTRMAQLTGEHAEKFNADFEKMKDGVSKFAAEYQERYGQLTTAQFQYIQQLEQQGRKEDAEYQLAKDIYEYLGKQAPQHLGYLEQAWNGVAGAIAKAWDELKAFGRESNADKIADLQKQIRAGEQFGAGAASPYVTSRQSELAHLQAAEAAEEKRTKATAEATARQKDGVAAAAKLHEQFEASKTSGEKLKAALAEIDVNLAKAVAADPANKALYEREAAAARSQAVKSDTPHGAKGPDAVSEWAEQLHAQQVASGEFFKDQTAGELAFWQSKLALTRSGSKDWLEVQSRIYEASKALAHQSYEQQLAALNDKLEGDRDNWSKEQSDWNAKLDFIRAHYGEESTEYQQAHREFEAAERQHQRDMGQIAREGQQAQLAELKAGLDAAKALRDTNARTAESQISARGQYSPLGEVRAATETMQLHQRLLEQERADDAAYHAAKEQLLQAEVASAAQAYGEESSQYRKAVDAKKQADQDWANQQRQLSAQMAQQQIADLQKIQQAWHGYIDPMVSTTGSNIKGLAEGTETWGQALRNVGEQAIDVVISALERMVENWIVGIITGQAAQRTAAMTQVVSYAGIAGAAGVASMAGAPFPIDLTAPAFGEAMAATALSFASMASLAVGTNVVPSDMIAQIHEGERIIPAADNKALMAAVAGGGAGRGPPAINYAPSYYGAPHTERESFEDWSSRHGAAFRKWFAGGVRDGWFRY